MPYTCVKPALHRWVFLIILLVSVYDHFCLYLHTVIMKKYTPPPCRIMKTKVTFLRTWLRHFLNIFFFVSHTLICHWPFHLSFYISFTFEGLTDLFDVIQDPKHFLWHFMLTKYQTLWQMVQIVLTQIKSRYWWQPFLMSDHLDNYVWVYECGFERL